MTGLNRTALCNIGTPSTSRSSTALSSPSQPTFEPLRPLAVQPFPGRPPNFVNASEAKPGEAPHVSENESGPAQPDRPRFPTHKGSVAPALRAAARLVLHAAVVAMIRKVLDQLIP